MSRAAADHLQRVPSGDWIRTDPAVAHLTETEVFRPNTITFIRRWAVVLALVALTGCGGNDKADDSFAVPDFRHVRCLDRVGVTFARDLNDLDFYRDAVNRDEDEKPGIAFVENYRIGVEYWNKVGAAGDPPSAPPDWILLQAQPFGQEKTVSEIVTERPPRSYVAYVRDPSQRRLDRFDRCLTPTPAEVERARERSK